MSYYNPIKDKNGYVHSIDMVHAEYFSLINANAVLDILRKAHDKYSLLSYQEWLDRKPCSKYDYYIHGVAIGGVYVSMGKYTDYDGEKKIFRLLDMFQIRVNPNKYMNEEWFKELLNELLQYSGGGWLRKYDYAIDVPVPIDSVQLFDCRKEKGLYKGTRYYGQSGRHGFVKIYDKGKELSKVGEEVGVLTRIEHTLKAREIPSLEKIYILDNDKLNLDYSKLNDTEIAIVEMYLRLKAMGEHYDLKLGRKMMAKLKEYITGSYILLEFEHILTNLIKHLEYTLNINDDDVMIITDDDGFLQVPSDLELPFD